MNLFFCPQRWRRLNNRIYVCFKYSLMSWDLRMNEWAFSFLHAKETNGDGAESHTQTKTISAVCGENQPLAQWAAPKSFARQSESQRSPFCVSPFSIFRRLLCRLINLGGSWPTVAVKHSFRKPRSVFSRPSFGRVEANRLTPPRPV